MKETRLLDRRSFVTTLAAGATIMAMPPSAASRAVQRELHGLFPIAYTPEGPDGKVEFDDLASQVTFLAHARVQGVAWPQIASGWTELSEKDRIQGAEVMVQAGKGDISVVIGVQSRTGNFAEIERYAVHAEKIGANGVICIPPDDVDHAGLLTLYQRLGKVTSLPIMIQAVGDFPVDLVVQMYETIPTVQYLKDESGVPIDRVGEITRRTNGGLKCFSGMGVFNMMSEMEAGFSGHCPATSLADLYTAAYDHYHAGDKRAAFETFGYIRAADTMFSQLNVNVLIARGVFKPTTIARFGPDMDKALAILNGPMWANTPDEIKRVLDTYLRPHLRV
ncbi:MAG TPA: dihydrodipicolinate synthase family protein [Woeseiaceae bacterium]|nr:dihydrodipicolinate synthase family protein [Woeseiaceae bacterium]